MIIAEFHMDAQQKIQSFCFYGHADYADYGHDIICSAVSVLSQNTVNALEELVRVPVQYQTNEDGFLSCTVEAYDDASVQLLFQTLLLGVRSIEESYGSQYVQVRCIQ